MGEDEMREAAMAASPALQPDFQSPKITQDQLDKLKELRRRRLQIKAKPNIQKTTKGNKRRAGKAPEKELSIRESQDDYSAVVVEDSAASPATKKDSLMGLDEVEPPSTLKRRQKLHWGLDTKERWERKANM
ncbi:uncharacterized protein LOC143892493 isoform X2 [Tasmannia lanceolata]|uniref:uncharacterized protein LOC143892493 isoform X2 n=1 Tax=Tasmannia lanceolata TaxID=3420 RepID=UPI0040639B9F